VTGDKELKMRKLLLMLLVSVLKITPTWAETFEVVATPLPPLMYLEQDQPKGFYVDVLQAMLAHMEGTDITITFYPAPRMFQVLAGNDRVFSLAIARDDSREQKYKWVGPIYPRVFAVYKLRSRSDIKFKSLEDAHSYEFGVGRGYAAENDLLKAGIPKERIQAVTEDSLNVKKLFGGRIDLVIMNDVMLQYLVAENGHAWSDVEKVMVVNDKYQFWYAFNKNMEDGVIRKFQHAFDQLKSNGRYDTIVKKYFK
jgi:polar amino acid transport system substrate-binding protein